MPSRRLPVRPDLDQLKHQAKDLLRAFRAGDARAGADFREHHPGEVDGPSARLADAQLVLARCYDASSWTRLTQSAKLSSAIWRDDLSAVRALVISNRALLSEPVLIRHDSNWGPPMTYAANLGRDRIIRMLHALGATDIESALHRAALQGQAQTARMLHELGGRPRVTHDALGGPAYTLNVEGTRVLLSMGAPLVDDEGNPLAPVEVVLQTDARDPAAKHAILELYAEGGVELLDTPTMALHRGRIDLLEQHLRRDPTLLSRTFTYGELYPPVFGCTDPLAATEGTPLPGSTLLHMAVEFDEIEIARWLLDQGMSPNAAAAVGRSGFGGHTALFNTVVSQPNFWMNHGGRGPFVAPMTELLLERGADPNVRASLWKRLHPGHGDPTRHDYRDVTPLGWGTRFHASIFVSAPAMARIRLAGGVV